MTRERTCIRCRLPIAEDAPAWQGDGGERLCIPCALGLTLPGRAAGDEGGQPRYALPPAVAGAVSAEIDLGTGRAWPIEVTDFSVDGLRFLSPVAFVPETPAVVTLRERAGLGRPACFAVEVRWVRPASDGKLSIGARVIAAVDGHHAALFARVLSRIAAKTT